MVAKNFRYSWTEEDLFTNPIIYSDLLRLDMQNVYYEEINDKKKSVKSIEER
jgi:hypothetical protein